MFRSIALVAFAVAASAQRWPTITVNSSGEIILQSLTRAAAFHLTGTTFSTGPTSGTGGVGNAVTPVTPGTSLVYVNVVSSTATNPGVSLPSITTIGQTVTFIQSSTQAAYNIWTQATSQFINSDNSATMLAVTATSRHVACVAVTSVRWNCATQGAQFFAPLAVVRTTTAATDSDTLTDAHSGQTVHITQTAQGTPAYTLNIPACSASNLGNYYNIIQTASNTAVAVTSGTFIIAPSSGTVSPSTTAAAPAATYTYPAMASGAAGFSLSVARTVRCMVAGTWHAL